jgi:hypothetical protein
MIDFELDLRVIDLRDRVRAFIADEVIAAEPRDVSEHGLDGALRAELQATETHKWAIARHASRARGVHSMHPRGDGKALGA